MVTIINLKISLESLTEAIFSLNLEQKRQLLVEILEQKIFAEEKNYEDIPEIISEIKAVRAEYETGEYLTLNEYFAQP